MCSFTSPRETIYDIFFLFLTLEDEATSNRLHVYNVNDAQENYAKRLKLLFLVDTNEDSDLLAQQSKFFNLVVIMTL